LRRIGAGRHPPDLPPVVEEDDGGGFGDVGQYDLEIPRFARGAVAELDQAEVARKQDAVGGVAQLRGEGAGG